MLAGLAWAAALFGWLGDNRMFWFLAGLALAAFAFYSYRVWKSSEQSALQAAAEAETKRSELQLKRDQLQKRLLEERNEIRRLEQLLDSTL